MSRDLRIKTAADRPRRDALRRQSAESGARPLAVDRAARADSRRADPGSRCGREGRDPSRSCRSSPIEGMAILMISSELPEVLGMSDRIAVMQRRHDGRRAVPQRGHAGTRAGIGTGTRLMPAMYRREAAVAAATLMLLAVMAVNAPDFFTPGNLNDMFLASLPVLVVALGMTLRDRDRRNRHLGRLGVRRLQHRRGRIGEMAGAAVRRRDRRLRYRSDARRLERAARCLIRMPSIVVTLATMIALRDGLRWATQGAWVQDLPRKFSVAGVDTTFVRGHGRCRHRGAAGGVRLGVSRHQRRAVPCMRPARTGRQRGWPASTRE